MASRTATIIPGLLKVNFNTNSSPLRKEKTMKKNTKKKHLPKFSMFCSIVSHKVHNAHNGHNVPYYE